LHIQSRHWQFISPAWEGLPSCKTFPISFELISFTYGPRPEDWKFWFSEPSDPYAGDFWAMVEEGRPWIDDEEAMGDHPQPMPGSWSEDV